jgi:SWI/SNF-related matrix-associated actin-dependent regulator 1 of chromatin subfamily A
MDDGLTQEQKARIEINRLQAIERLRQRQLRLAPEGKSSTPFESDTVKPGNGATKEDPTANAQVERTTARVSKEKSLPLSLPLSAPLSLPPAPKTIRNVRVAVQLETTKSFSTMACPALQHSYRIIPGARFSHEDKLWRFPLSSYTQFLESLGSNRPSPEDQLPKTVLTIFESPEPPKRHFDLSCIGSSLMEAIYPFQEEGITMALQRNGRVILADDMGLGKSIQALGIACYYRMEWPLLIIAPASMVASWYEQVKNWLPSVNREDICVTFDGKAELTGLINILSYDLAVKLLPASNKSFNVIIADECHALKNSESKRCKTLLPIIKAASRAILLSGTPALSRPLELYPQIQAVQPKLFPKFFDFGRRYCAGHEGYFGWDFKGSSNLRELQLVLERTVMIRRTKAAVLSQLPRKLRHQIFLKVSPRELETYKKLLDLRTNLTEIDDEALEAFQKKAEYMALWKRTAEIKLPAMIEYVDDLLEAGRKILIFAHHQSVLDAFEGHLVLKKVKFMRIDGKTPPSSRQELCGAFQTDDSFRVALLSITAASTGITLTAATTVIFAELFFNPGVLLQAEDRAHRIGQMDAVNVHYLLARGTSDDAIWPLILKKLSMLEAVGLGTNDFNNISKQDHDPTQMRLDKFLTKRPGDANVDLQSTKRTK